MAAVLKASSNKEFTGKSPPLAGDNLLVIRRVYSRGSLNKSPKIAEVRRQGIRSSPLNYTDKR